MNYLSDTVSCDCDLSSSNFNLKDINTEKNKFNVKNLFGKSLEDRKKYLYQNVNVCKDNCMYKKMNYFHSFDWF